MTSSPGRSDNTWSTTFLGLIVLISVRRSQDGKKTHQKSYDERAGEMLMPFNQINQTYHLRRVCWNHFSFFHHFFPILIQPTSKRYDHNKYQFFMGFRMVYVSHLRLYTEILPCGQSNILYLNAKARTFKKQKTTDISTNENSRRWSGRGNHLGEKTTMEN